MKFPMDRPVKIVMLGAGGTGGYVAPYLDAAGKLIAVQSDSVKSAITFTFVGLETITGVVLAILLLFLNVEKNIAREQEEIKQRNGETTDESNEA